MTADAVTLVLTAADPACRDAGAQLFPGAPHEVLMREALRPLVPFEGLLFELLGARPRGTAVGLVVPVLLNRGEEAPGDLVPVADHVGLEVRGPLAGPWPADVPRDFPSMTGIYQPGLVRPSRGARVYSSGVVAAGVADARRLTRYEARALREGGWPIVSDAIVPAAIVAAYHGLKLAACGCVQAPTDHRE